MISDLIHALSALAIVATVGGFTYVGLLRYFAFRTDDEHRKEKEREREEQDLKVVKAIAGEVAKLTERVSKLEIVDRFRPRA